MTVGRAGTTPKCKDFAPQNQTGTGVGNFFTFATFTLELLRREAIDRGRWSDYAWLARFDTTLGWRTSYG